MDGHLRVAMRERMGETGLSRSSVSKPRAAGGDSEEEGEGTTLSSPPRRERPLSSQKSSAETWDLRRSEMGVVGLVRRKW